MRREAVPLFGKPYDPPKRKRKAPKPVDLSMAAVPPEYVEQQDLAKYLDARGFDWFWVPNERKTDPIRGARLNRQGRKKGVPDVHIWNQPPGLHGVTGVVLELKRADKTMSAVTPEQREWRKKAERNGKKHIVAFGCPDAIGQLEALFPPGWSPFGKERSAQ
jgi:hypothetical protein